jgi:hypothetical protein
MKLGLALLLAWIGIAPNPQYQNDVCANRKVRMGSVDVTTSCNEDDSSLLTLVVENANAEPDQSLTSFGLSFCDNPISASAPAGWEVEIKTRESVNAVARVTWRVIGPNEGSSSGIPGGESLAGFALRFRDGPRSWCGYSVRFDYTSGGGTGAGGGCPVHACSRPK